MTTRICSGVARNGQRVGISVRKVHEAIDAAVARFEAGEPVGMSRGLFFLLVQVDDLIRDEEVVETTGAACPPSVPPSRAA